MLSVLLSTFASVGVATLGAALFGFALGQLATESFGSRQALGRLTELRGALPTLVAAPLLDRWLELPPPLMLGLLVGGYQGLAVARWIRGVRALRRTTIPSDSLPPPDSRWRVLFAPAVRTLLAHCAVHVVTLEALLSLFELPPVRANLGSLLAQSFTPGARFAAVLTLTCLFLALDQGALGGRTAARRVTADRPPPRFP